MVKKNFAAVGLLELCVAATAQELGATRPSLSRVLSEMLDEGVVIEDGKGYRKA